MKLVSTLLFAAIAQPLEGALRIVVPYPPGGASDRAARLVANRLNDNLGMSVAVANRTGAGGRLAMQQLKSTPAGQSVMVVGNPALMVVAPVFRDVAYDARRDFVRAAHVTNCDFAVAVGPRHRCANSITWPHGCARTPSRPTSGFRQSVSRSGFLYRPER